MVDLVADYEYLSGQYGSNDLDMQMVRLGAEIDHNLFVSRYGLIIPVKISSTEVPDINLPFPFAPTFGLGWSGEYFDVDLAAYAHPIMSYHKNAIAPAFDMSVTIHF